MVLKDQQAKRKKSLSMKLYTEHATRKLQTEYNFTFKQNISKPVGFVQGI